MTKKQETRILSRARKFAHHLDAFLAERGCYMPESTFFRLQEAKDLLREFAKQPELKLDPATALQLVADARQKCGSC